MTVEVNHTVEPVVAAPTLEQEAAAQRAAAAAAAKPVEAAPVVPATPPAAVAKPDRPAWLPAEFESPEAMAKAFADMKAAQKPAEAQKPADATTPAADATKPATEAPKSGEVDASARAAEALNKAGIDVSPFQSEYAQTGDISAESRAKLAEGLKAQFGEQSRAMVDSFIEGQKAVATNLRTAALAEVGGEDGYKQIATWARTGMSKDQLGAFNKAVESGDMNTVVLAMRGLKASFEAANGKAPSLVKGENLAPGAGENGPFASTREMVEAINNPKYAVDPAYRSMVARRIQAGKSR